MALAILQYDSKTKLVKAVLRPSEKRLALLDKDGVSLDDFVKGEKDVGADAFIVIEDEAALGLKDVPFHRWQVEADGAVVMSTKPTDLVKQRGEIEANLNAILAKAFRDKKRELTTDEQAAADELQGKLDLIDAVTAP